MADVRPFRRAGKRWQFRLFRWLPHWDKDVSNDFPQSKHRVYECRFCASLQSGALKSG